MVELHELHGLSVVVWFGDDKTWRKGFREERLEKRVDTLLRTGRGVFGVERLEKRVDTPWNAGRRVSSKERLEERVDTPSS